MEAREAREAGWPASARLQLKPYQKECLEAAKSHNLLAVLPTNSGKTLVAASLAEHYTGSQPQPLRGKVVFLAPTVALVEQQARVLADHLGAVRWDQAQDEEDSNSNPTSNSNSTLSRRLRWRMHHGKLTAKDSMEPCEEDSDSSGMQCGSDFWQSADIFVLTPFFLLSSLVHAQVRMHDLGLLVLDEAHHTQRGDQYSLIMKYFYRAYPASSRPRVLGLTASPFKGSAHSNPEELHKSLVELEELLDCTAWTSTACCPPPATAHLFHFQGDPSSSTSSSLLSVSQEVLEGDAQAADAEIARKFWRQLKDIVLGDDPLMQAMGAWAGVETLRLVCKEHKKGWALLDDDDEQSEKAGKRAAVRAAWGVRCRSLLRRLDDWERVNGPQLLLDSSPSLQALLSLLRKRESPGLRALVFVQTRLRALLVHRFLQRDPSLQGTTAPVVSSNQRTSALHQARWDTTSSNQRNTLQSFRGEGQTGGGQALRVLVATPVLEEGIDVPNCSLVVRFDPPKTPIENIQSRGRARHSESEYIHLVHNASSRHPQLLKDFERDEEALHRLLGTTTDNFQSRREARPQPRAESHDNVLEVPSTGALLPMEMAVDFLRRIYVHHSAPDGGEGPNAIHFAEPHFSLKEKSNKASNFSGKQTNTGAWQFSVRLPHVGGCSVVLPKQLEVQGKELLKDQAKQSAALEAVRALHRHGVLDDRLHVVGRRECLEKLKRAAGGLTQHVGSHRSDDNVAEGRMEDIILQLPPCLREPPQNTSDPLFLHCVHGLPLEDTGPGLGLLLAGSVGAPLPFVLLPEGGVAECTLASLGPVKLTEAELAEVAHWTACALELSNIHMMLAPWAVPHRSGGQVPRLNPREGDYTAGLPARAVNHTTRSERAWFAIVPLGHTGSIDWEFLRWGLRQMETAQFPLLIQEGHEQAARPLASAAGADEGGGHEHTQLEHFPGLPTSLDLSQAVLLGPSRDDSRQHLYSWASVSQAPCLNLDGPVLLDAEHVSRHMQNAVSAHNHRDRDKEAQQLLPQHCRCLPISLSQLLLLKLLPGVLWRVAHLAVVREVLEQEKGLGGAALQHVADALTHRAACAPGTERPTRCHYEVLEFLGDAVLKCLACTWVFATFPDAAEGQLSKEAQKLQSNYFLRKCLLRHGWQRAFLATAFRPKRSLESLRTQRVSHKQQADVVEALLGASFLQGQREGARSTGAQHSVDAAVGFFSRYLLPQLQLEGIACGCGCGSGSGSGWGEGPAVHLHPCSYGALLRPWSAAATGTAAAPASARKFTFGDYLEEPRLLLEETKLEFQRLEFLGDAALQLLVSEHLLQTFPDHSEGDLSELRSSLVCNEHLARKMLRRLSTSCSGVGSGGSVGSVGSCTLQKFFPPGMLEPVKAFAERLSHQGVGADFVVGRGLGLASSALSATAEGAVEVVEAPKCIADLYEAIVGAMLLHSDGSLEHVWHSISADFHIEPHEAESGLRRRREALMQIASIACCRPTVKPDPERKEEARRRWSEKVGRLQLEVERRRVQEANEAKRQGAAGAALEAHLQRDPLFAGLDVGKWLQAPRSRPPSTPALSPVAPASDRTAAAADPGPKSNSAPAASASASASTSASTSPPASAHSVSEVVALPGQPSGIFVGVLQHERSGNRVTATLSMRLSAGAEQTQLSSSGADSGPDLERVYTEIRRKVFAQLGLLDVPPQVEQGGLQGMLRTVLARAGPEGKGLADFGNDPAVSDARKAFDVPKTRKLKDLLQQWPEVFELSGEGAGTTVRLRQQA